MGRSVYKIIPGISLFLFVISATPPPSAMAQATGLLAELFSSSTKSDSSSTRKESSSSSRKNTSGANEDFLTALTGKTAKERAREQARRQKEAERAREKAEAEREKAARERADELAEKKRANEARKEALAALRAKEIREKELATAKRQREMEKLRQEQEKIDARREADAELLAMARGRERFGLFGRRLTSVNSSQSRYEVSRYLYINERETAHLTPYNSRIEIDLSDQRARVFNGSTLVIETQISSGRAGYSTPTGHYSIKEKLVDKRSGRYGTWFSRSGVELNGDDKYDPPSGASQFVGADMPYWLRITGGIGMHVGFVPDGPASHGCVRVPSNVQPLIFSKVRVGTPVTIRH